MTVDETVAQLENRVAALETELVELRRMIAEISLEDFTEARREVIRKELRPRVH